MFVLEKRLMAKDKIYRNVSFLKLVSNYFLFANIGEACIQILFEKNLWYVIHYPLETESIMLLANTASRVISPINLKRPSHISYSNHKISEKFSQIICYT